jgi:glutamate-1-semialdehyde 2,1-aminomutase
VHRKPVTRNTTLDEALREAELFYAAANPKSRARHEAALEYMPGGNTRSNLYFSPFPLGIAYGKGAQLTDLDGHSYIDFLGEYTAGLFGHSHPDIRAAVLEALDQGIDLGGPNRWEAELARLMCARFPSLDKVRFCNSGTEANLYTILAARAVTGRTHVMVFEGGYHGGVFAFAGSSALRAPFPFLIGQYNDLDGTAAMIERYATNLAAVVIEPMLGSGGGIAAERPFLEMLRQETKRRGIVLVFDEVMTSRLAPGGLQEQVGIFPDMTTFGKYLGGGLTFGAFGGHDVIMRRFDPTAPDTFVHSGTYNNNATTMAAGVAALSTIYTAEAAQALNAKGNRLRERMNDVFRRHGVAMQMLGQGSINCIHVHGQMVRRWADAVNDPQLQALLHLHLLEHGIYLARRGFSALCLPLRDDDIDRFVEVVDDFCTVYRPLLDTSPLKSTE